MRRIFALLAAAVVAAGLCLPAAAADGNPPDTLSQAYVVMDADSGQVILEKNGGRREYPASITKVLTVALVLEGHDPDETFELGEEVREIDAGSTYVALSPGERVTVEQMAYAAMLPSANDAANGLAVFDAGSMDAFVEKMNAKARELGATETRFANPSGLHNPEHYTTARDFALITRWAMTVPGFMTYFGADEYTMPATNKQREQRPWGTNNCLTVESAYLYDGATGGKLGYTPEANHTLAASAQRDGLNVVVVELNSKSKWDKFKDAVALLDYTFANFERGAYEVPKLKETPRVPYYVDGQKAGNVMLELPRTVPFVARKGQAGTQDSLSARLDVPDRYGEGDTIAPRLVISRDGQDIFSTDLPYTLDVKAVTVDEPVEPADPAKMDKVVRILTWAAGIVAVALVVLMIWAAIMRRIRRRRRMRRRSAERGGYRRR